MASVRATNPAQITSMRTAKVVAAQRVLSGLPDVRVRGGGVRTRARAPSNATTTGAAPNLLPDCPFPAAVVNPSNIET
jgi:hypothetical protein